MRYINDNGEVFRNPLHYNGRLIFNPKPETLLAAGYHEDATPVLPTEPVEPVYRFSKYKLKQLLGDEGWAAKKQELIDADLWEDFMLADCLATDDSLFGPIWADLGEEEKQLLIDNCQFED